MILFVPLGASLAGLGLPGPLAALLGLAASGVVEGLQYTLIAGRDASLSDLVANTAGTALGWALMAHRARLVRPAPGAARAFLVAWLGFGIGTLVFTRWALRADLPPGPWYGQWVTGAPEPDFFSGRVLEVRLGGVAVPQWLLPEGVERAARTGLRDTVRAEAVLRAGGEEVMPRRILSFAADSARFVSFGTGHGDLSFGVRIRAARLLLLSPRFTLPDAMKLGEGDTVRIGGWYADGRARVWSNGESGRAGEWRLGPFDPWVFLWPGSGPRGALLWLLRAGTLVVLVGPVWVWSVALRRA